MARLLRFEQPGEVFHLISRCARDRWILEQGDPDRSAFRRALEIAQERSDTEVLAFAAMANHLHLVVLAGATPLGSFMRRFLGALAWRVNRSVEGSGAFVGGRYKALIVEKEEYLCRLIAYVHANPLRAGVADTIWDGRRTSAQAYRGGREPAVLPWRAAELLGTSVAGLVQEMELLAPEVQARDPVLSMDADPELERQRQAIERERGTAVARTGPGLGGDAFWARILDRNAGFTETIQAAGGLRAAIQSAPAPDPELDALLDALLEEAGCPAWTPPSRGRPPRQLRMARWLAANLAEELTGCAVRELAPRVRLSAAAVQRDQGRPGPEGAGRAKERILRRWRHRRSEVEVRPRITIDV